MGGAVFRLEPASMVKFVYQVCYLGGRSHCALSQNAGVEG